MTHQSKCIKTLGLETVNSIINVLLPAATHNYLRSVDAQTTSDGKSYAVELERSNCTLHNLLNKNQ